MTFCAKRHNVIDRVVQKKALVGRARQRARLLQLPGDEQNNGGGDELVDMEALHTIWSFLLLLALLAFPQLFGVLLFFLLKGRPHFLAHALSFITPILMSIFFSWMIFIYRYYQAHPNERCGGPLLGGLMITLVGACLQLVFGVLAQVTLHSRTAVCGPRLKV